MYRGMDDNLLKFKLKYICILIADHIETVFKLLGIQNVQMPSNTGTSRLLLGKYTCITGCYKVYTVFRGHFEIPEAANNNSYVYELIEKDYPTFREIGRSVISSMS